MRKAPSRLRWALLAIPLVGLAELGAQIWATHRAPSFDAWAAVEAPVRALKQPGDLVIIAPDWADPLARRALRVSMGHSLHLPHARTDDLTAAITSLTAAGTVVCALTPAPDALPLDQVPHAQRMAVIVGSERAGLTSATMAAATHCVSIPMQDGVDSLNVAAATAIACWQLRSVGASAADR